MAKKLKLYSFANFNHLFGALGEMNGLDLDRDLLDESLVDCEKGLQVHGPVIFSGVRHVRVYSGDLVQIKSSGNRITASRMTETELSELVYGRSCEPDTLELVQTECCGDETHQGHQLLTRHFGMIFVDCRECAQLYLDALVLENGQWRATRQFMQPIKLSRRKPKVEVYKNSASAFFQE